MSQIDRVGTFIALVTESAYGTTAKDLPQWVARFLAEKKYVVDKAELEHFKLDAPAYVDWNFDESIVSYLCMFSAEGKPLLNYEQIVKATGWDGTDFQDLATLVGKRVLIRVEEDNYNGKVSLKVNWVDAADAPPERTLRQLAPDKVKADSAKWLKNLAKPPAPVVAAAAAKPPAKPAGPGPAAPQDKAAIHAAAVAALYPDLADRAPAAPAAPAVPATPPAAAEVPVVTPKKSPPGRKPKAPPAAAPAPEPAAPAGPPKETTQLEGWEYVNRPEVKGQNEDSVVEEAWIAAAAEIGADIEQDKFTPDMWAKVRDIVIKDLGAK